MFCLNRVFFSLIVPILFCLSVSYADEGSPNPVYEKLRSEYRELTIKDPFLSDIVLWRELRGRLLELSSTMEGDSFYPNLLYLKARVSEQLGKKLKDNFLIKESESDFLKITNNYYDSALVDEALLGLSRIADYNKNSDLKIQYAEQVVREYPDSDSVEFATRVIGESPKEDQEIKSRQDEVGDLLLKYPVIVLDPGHGGTEEGAKGPLGILEKDVVLKLSFALKDLLQKDPNLRVVMTRTGDEVISLADRTRIANENNAELFVSIHANASEYKTMRGLETYYLDNTDDKSSLKLAERENFTSVGEQDSVGFIVSDFIQAVKIDDSISLSHLVHDNLYKTLSQSFDGVRNLGVKKAPFFVLVGAHMPCILVEVSFIDHPVEGRRLGDPRYQSIVAEGLYKGIIAYLKKKGRLIVGSS